MMITSKTLAHRQQKRERCYKIPDLRGLVRWMTSVVNGWQHKAGKP